MMLKHHVIHVHVLLFYFFKYDCVACTAYLLLLMRCLLKQLLLLIVLAQDEVDKKGLSQKEVADNNQGIFLVAGLV